MDQKMNVQVSFSADTKQAKKEISDLVQSINALSAGTMKTSLMKEISADTKKAAHEVGQFSVMLQRAVNTDTGKLDLTKLNKSLKTANLDLNKVANSFKALGNDGVKAFASVVNQINAAEVPIKKMNATVDKLWTSLKNTANWTISSSAINALVSGVQNAYRYAQDLDKSLNNIRIVTGYTADKMSQFAVEANKAAKALNTTTQNYTDASLIFYQQGLSDAEVAKRTEVVVKMANVTGETAEKISDQMTAVWNNFADGSKSLEYYADVLTKLGATTASSTDEIVGGLEKFAAVADTIGLSYEYAASALATITSNTRQSEEVVGTALKTIFARIQGLNLGETLDDGTTLNKYSEALQKVGISIFDQAGNLKKMDDILNEMGSKWGTLSDSQQVALAQTVAGVRQYNQLVALMDSWNKSATQGGVSMAENLRTTQNATGELSDQANIYADGWKAAQDRVKASAEQLYDVLIDEEFFKDILNAASGILDFITDLTQGLGGVEGLLSTISAYVLNIAKTQISKELIRLTQPSTKKQQQMALETKDNANAQLSRISDSGKSNKSDLNESRVIETTYKNIADVQRKMVVNADRLTEEQKALVEQEIEHYKFISDIVAKKAKEADLAKKELEYAEKYVQVMSQRAEKTNDQIDSMTGTGGLLNRQKQKFSQSDINEVNALRQQVGQQVLTDEQVAILSDASVEGEKYKEVIKQIKTELLSAKTNLDSFTASLDQYKKDSQQVAQITAELDFIDLKSEDAESQIESIIGKLEKLGGAYKEAAKDVLGCENGFEDFIEKLKAGDISADNLESTMGDLSIVLDEVRTKSSIDLAANTNDPQKFLELSTKIDNAADSTERLAIQERLAAEQGKGLGKNIDNLNTTFPTWQEAIVAAAGALASFISAGQALAGMWDTLKDPSIDGWEKITTVFSTLLTVVPSVLMAFKSLSDAKLKDVGINVLNTLSEKLLAKAKKEGAESSEQLTGQTEKENQAQIKNIALDGVEQVTSKGGKGKIGGKGMPKTKMPAGGTGGAPAAGAGAGASPTLSAGGASLGASLAIVAAGIAILVAGIAWAVHQANEAERAVEKAKQAAQELTDNYNVAKAAADEFNSSVSAYQDARSALDDLTKGTEEYSEAVKNANERAMELLDTNENLKYTIENGQIVIDEESIKEQKKVQEENEEKAFAAKIAGQTQLSRAEENLKKRDAARELKSYSDNTEKGRNAAAMGIIGGIGAGLATGAAAGAIGGLGVFSAPAAIIGAVVGAVAGGVAGVVANTSTDTENDALEKLEKAYLQDETVLQQLKDGSLDFASIGITDPALIQSLTDNADEVSKLIEEMGANTKAIQAQNDLVAANALANNEKVTQSEYQDEIIDIAGDAYGIAYDKALQSDWVSSWGKDGIAKINGANDEAKKVFEEYLKYAGLEGQGYELTDTTGDDNNRKFVYKDAEGNEQTISLEAMQAARAAYEASGVMEQTAENLAKTFDRLAMSANEADHAMLSFLSQKNFEGATKSEFESFGSSFTGKTPEEVSAQLADYLDVDALTDEVAAQYGYATASEMVSAITTQVKAAQEAWKEIELPKNLSESISTGMTLDMAQQVEAQVNKINLGPLGKKAGEQYASQLNKMLAGLDTEDQQAALAQLTQIDWSDWDASERMVEIMDSFGVEIDTASSSWISFVNNMRMATGSTQDLVALKAELIEISNILNDLTIGSSIGEEQYQALIKYKKEWEDFFLMQADGTRKFIGNEKDMQDAIADTLRAGAESSVQHQEYAEAIEAELEAAAKAAKGTAAEETGEYFSLGISDADLERQAGGDGLDGTFYLGKQENGKQDQYAVQALRDMGYYVDEDGKVYTNDAKDEAVTHAEAGRLVIARQRGIWAKEHVLDNEAVQEALSSKGYTEEIQKEILAEALAGNDDRLKKMLDELQEFVTTDYDQLSKEYQEMLASTADSLEELDKMTKREGFDPETQSKGLIALASQYENCTEKIKAFKEALQFGTAEEQAVAEQELRIGIVANEIAADTGMDADAVEILIEQYMSEYADATVDQAKTAIQNQIGQRQFALGLSENWKEWNEGLGSNDTIKRAEAMAEIFKSFGDSFGIEDFEVPPEFFEVEENLQLMEKAAKGNVDALKQLQTKLKLSYVFKMKQIDVSDEKLAELTTKIQAYLNRFDFKIGISYSFGTEQLEEARKILKSAEEEALASGKTFTQEDANYILSLLGVTGRFSAATATPVKGDIYSVDFGSESNKPQYKFWERLSNVTSLFNQSEDEDYDLGGDDETEKNTLSEQQKALEDKKKALLYDEEKALKDIEKQLKKNNRLIDQSYGKNKINAIKERIRYLDEENEQIQKQIDLYNDQIIAQDEAWAKKIGEKLNSALAAYGKDQFTIEFDEEGLVNAEIILANLAQQIHDLQLANHGQVISEEAQKKIDELMSLYNLFTAAINTLDESHNKVSEWEERLVDNVDEQMSLRFQEWEYSLQLNIEINDSALRYLDLVLKEYENKFYKIAELMSELSKNKVPLLDDSDSGMLTTLQAKFAELKTLKDQNKITDADYVAGLKAIEEQAYSSVEALYELNAQMLNYYSDALDEGSQKLKDHISQFDNLLATLDHYSNVVSMVGGEEDYESMNAILQGRIEVLNDKVAATKAVIASYDEQIQAVTENIQNATTAEDREYWEERLKQLNDLKAEEQKNLYSYLEEIGADANKILENSIKQAFDKAESAMTGGMSFDTIISDMEKINSLQDEYMTTTNKMYETNMLLSKAQSAIDKSSSEASKKKYQDYIAYIEKLQVSGNLSKQELKIAQARLSVLEAESALEDAKNAKSTVRLQRDSAGNYGYVYTADQDSVKKAQDDYLKAQNELYNIGLEGTNEYREKIIQLQRDTLNELEQLEIDYRVNGLMSEEEYNRKKQSIEETASAKLKAYQEQFLLAQDTMAKSGYDQLMLTDSNFQTAQLSQNADHHTLMAESDAKYYGGIKTEASNTQDKLQEDLANFGVDILESNKSIHSNWAGEDRNYFQTAKEIAEEGRGYLQVVFDDIKTDLAGALGQEGATATLNEFEKALAQALSDCSTATTTWQTNLSPVVDAVGLSFDGAAGKIDNLPTKIDTVTTSSDNLITSFDTLSEDIDTLWGDIEDATLAWQEHWEEIDNVIESYKNLITEIGNLKLAESGMGNFNDPGNDPGDDPGSDPGDDPGSDPGNDPGSDSEMTREVLTDLVYDIGLGKYKNNPERRSLVETEYPGWYDRAQQLLNQTIDEEWEKDLYNHNGSEWKKKVVKPIVDEYASLHGFKTGGYTGSWGPEGRLAMLHEKELVLNAQDTVNLLDTISIVRDIVSDFGNIGSWMPKLFMPQLPNIVPEPVEKIVQIEANFPGVRDRYEIEEAFNNLINTASQFANRKKI